MITVRLPKDLESEIKTVAGIEKRSKSDLIKEALDEYMKKYRKTKSSYELGADLFGKYGSKKGNLSTDYKKIMKERLLEKYSH